MAIVVNGPGTPGPQGPQGPTGPAGDLTANTGISVGGTLTSQHIVPDAADTYDLGNTAAFFRDLYIGTGSVNFTNLAGETTRIGAAADGTLQITYPLSLIHI